MMWNEFERIWSSEPRAGGGEVIGTSRQGRSIRAYVYGCGPIAVSLIGGCHADEPVGPCLLRKLSAWLGELPASSRPLEEYTWLLVPHVNPDGESKNAEWVDFSKPHADIAAFIRRVQREGPRDDVEFSFPGAGEPSAVRPENAAVWSWWKERAPSGAALHVSLHGMAIAPGMWFLLSPWWPSSRVGTLMEVCRRAADERAYPLFDYDRRGEKGFHCLAPGFSTHPTGIEMRRYFLDRDDAETARCFANSSMEAARALQPEALTLVSEAPLFLLPNLTPGSTYERDDLGKWRELLGTWKERLEGGARLEEIRREAQCLGIRPVPFRDQMFFQWRLITAGLETLRAPSA